MFWNPYVLAGIGVTVLLLIGGAGYQGYSYGYELAELRCNSRVQSIKDEVARRNETIRAEEARRRQEIDAMLARRTAEVQGAARLEASLRKRVEDYEAALATRGDKCQLTEEDVRQLQ